MSRQTRSSARPTSSDTMPNRKRRFAKVSYKEPGSDDDYESGSDGEAHPRKKFNATARVTRRNPKRNSTKLPTPLPTPSPKPKRKLIRRGSISSVSSISGSTASESPNDIDTDATVMSVDKPLAPWKLPWESLEYGILFAIFDYAARALEEDKKSSNGWLINSATICRTFQAPALTALYYNPPLDTVEAVRGFLAMAARNPGFCNAVVKHIAIEAIPALTRKDRTQEPVSLESILDAAPNIRSLAVELHGDAPSSKRAVVNLPVKGKANVFKPTMIETMEKNKTRLRSMKWNYFFNPDQQWPWCELPEIHSNSCMQTIENLDIVWLNFFTKSINKEKQVESLVEGLKVLPNLKSLSLSLCSLFYQDESLLTKLPNSLESITIIDCDDLTSEVLAEFLSSHGSNLRHLILNHNRSLDLGFMDVLATACPHLEELKVDMSCYGLLLSSLDGEPSFQYLLPQGLVPTWPTSLRRIEMSYLRKWEREAARIFFQSLVNASDNLRNLRQLVVKTTVDLDWRDRVEFRDEWTDRLQQIFKRRPSPPRTNNSISKKSSRKITGAATKPGNSNGVTKKSNTRAKDSIANRLRTRLQDMPSHGNRRNKIPDIFFDGACKMIVTTDSLTAPSSILVQGLCNVVDIRIENLRPMETQYAERDFMDEEISGDEDWTGEEAF